MTQILQPTPQNLDQLAAALAQGEIVAIPTETVYGLAGNALDSNAVRRIYEAKGRPARNPLIAHIGEPDQLDSIATPPSHCMALIEQFWPGPLTIILPKKPIVPNTVTAGLDTVAVRMPAHPVFRQLIARCSFPLAAPSANPFGYVSPTMAEHVQQQMTGKLDWILDGGPCDRGIESTIVSFANPTKPTILRHGSISAEELSHVLNQPVLTPDTRNVDAGQSLRSPGLMKRHYSPKTPVSLFKDQAPVEDQSAILFLNRNSCTQIHHFALSENGNLQKVAQNLYRMLQEIDRMGFKVIYMELPTADGLGMAIRDRMARAASR